MADGSVTLILDDATLARLESVARDFGMSPGDYAETILANALSRWDVAEDLRRLAEYDRTGESVSVEEAFAHLREKIAERRAQRA
ncbi:MAG: hypothetical protein Q7T19_02990 [Caulobacter sp.]|nr:hypothetical protein [Caulobacter sp.]